MSVYSNATSQSHLWVPIFAEQRKRHQPKGEEVEILDYVLAHIDHYEGDQVFVNNDVYGAMCLDRHKCQQYDKSHGIDQPDIGNMNNLATGPLLDVLRRRYNTDKIYTWTGKILISINPYFIIPGLYDIPTIRSDIDNGKEAFREDPHVFTVAERAYCDLLGSTDERNQSLIVSGESGAGKTEACKRVMNMLAEISKAVLAKDPSGSNQGVEGIEAKVLGCNPFLEAFGNAKTNRNDNSSRFGKFLKIEYSHGKIIGAHMKQYLLEKSRVINPGPDERSYHIFYQLILGCPDELRQELALRPMEEYYFLNRSGCYQVPNMDDVKEFNDVCESLITVGIDAAMQQDIFRVVSAILTLGNVQFGERESDADSGTMLGTIETPEEIATVARLISCPDVEMNMLQRQVRAGGGGRRTSVTIVKLNQTQAMEACEALAKHLYGNLFSFLVTKVNSLLATSGSSDRFIGILDIFGFEIFEQNSFEQLCINYTNEKLQNLFNHHVFTLEEQQYVSEGVDFSSVAIRDNTDCVRLIESKPHGILIQLDQICRVGRSSKDTDFLQKLDRAWDKPKDKNMLGQAAYYVKPKVRNPDNGSDMLFTVLHFAGPVHYCVDQFLEKNKDALHGDLEFMCESSESDFVSALFRKDSVAPSQSKKGRPGRATPNARRMTKMPATIAVKFKDQLDTLNKELLRTDPHYIRCVKPNASKAVHDYTSDMVLRQLIYSGVLETVRIRREGYPFRKPFDEFWEMCLKEGFDKLAESPPGTSSKECIRKMLTSVFLGNEDMKDVWQLGYSKVFLKDAAYEFLQDFKREKLALQLQTWWRMAFPSRRYRRVKRVVLMLQKIVRRLIFANQFAALSGQTIKIQSAWRRKQAQVKCNLIRAAYAEVLAIRAAEREELERWERLERERMERLEREREKMEAAQGVLARTFRSHRARIELKKRQTIKAEEIKKLIASATVIQSKFRSCRALAQFKQQLKAIISMNNFVRDNLVRKRAYRRRRALVSLQAIIRGHLELRKYVRKYRSIIKIQTIGRMHSNQKKLRRFKRAASRIACAHRAYHRNSSLYNWIEEVFTTIEVGDDGFAEDLLEFHEDVEEYYYIRDVAKNAANIRHAPSFATLLHSACKSETASPVLVMLLTDAGAVLDEVVKSKGRTMYWCARDVNGNTPLHTVASLGDRYLAVAAQLLDSSCAKLRFLNHENEMGATALDIAIDNALSASSTNSDCFTGLVRWMFASGAASMIYGTQAEVEGLLSELHAGKRRAEELALERERRRAAIEREKLKSTTAYKLAEIRGNEGARKKKEEEDKIAAAERQVREAEAEKQREKEAALAEQLEHAVSAVLLLFVCCIELEAKWHYSSPDVVFHIFFVLVLVFILILILFSFL